jgi:hypothetical protein
MTSDATQALESQAVEPDKPLEYDAFLSYAHRDRLVATGIQKGLHQVMSCHLAFS